MTSYVIDASAVVAILIDAGPDGEWVANTVEGATLHAPDLMLYEAANISRRNRLARLLDDTAATLAHTDLLDLTIHCDPYSGISDRVWELRDNGTVYDAAYVALAETRDIPLLTLDTRLSKASGPKCRILTP